MFDHTLAIGAAVVAVQALLSAMHKAEMQEQQLADALDISPAQLSRAIHGAGAHIPFDRMDGLPRAAKVALIDELTVRWGIRSALDDVREALAEIRRVLEGKAA